MNQKTITEYLNTLSDLTAATEVTDGRGEALSLESGSASAIQMLVDARSASRKVMLAGNGGSSAIVSHVQNDLAEAGGVRAMVFTESPVLTARANDFGYPSVFERPIELWGEPDDLLLTVSSSGQSENIIRALNAAKEKRCKAITFSGFKPDNPSRSLGDLNFYVPSEVYAYVETIHMSLLHFLTTGLPAK